MLLQLNAESHKYMYYLYNIEPLELGISTSKRVPVQSIELDSNRILANWRGTRKMSGELSSYMYLRNLVCRWVCVSKRKINSAFECMSGITDWEFNFKSKLAIGRGQLRDTALPPNFLHYNYVENEECSKREVDDAFLSQLKHRDLS